MPPPPARFRTSTSGTTSKGAGRSSTRPDSVRMKYSAGAVRGSRSLPDVSGSPRRTAPVQFPSPPDLARTLVWAGRNTDKSRYARPVGPLESTGMAETAVAEQTRPARPAAGDVIVETRNLTKVYRDF